MDKSVKEETVDTAPHKYRPVYWILVLSYDPLCMVEAHPF
jgi:hypothetical protein